MPKKKEAESGEKPVEIEPEAETVEAEEPSSVETTEDSSLQQEEVPEVEPLTREEEQQIWLEDSLKKEAGERSPDIKPLDRAKEERIWLNAVKKHDAEVEALKKREADEQKSLIKNIEDKVTEDFPDSYRVTDWAGHPNFECNRCGFASLDKFKLYAHLIQAHSGIEQDYRGETTHS